MVIIDSCTTAIIMCIITMICWGSWPKTMKITKRKWTFQLFYWDYSLGVLLMSLILALVVGVTLGYIVDPSGNPGLIFTGLASVILAIIIDGIAYGKIPSEGNRSVKKGIIISVIAGIVMGVFYPILVMSLSQDLVNPLPGRLTPYSAIVMFALGLFLSSFIWNFYLMGKPIVGIKVTFKDYFTLGTRKYHLAGLLAGIKTG